MKRRKAKPQKEQSEKRGMVISLRAEAGKFEVTGQRADGFYVSPIETAMADQSDAREFRVIKEQRRDGGRNSRDRTPEQDAEIYEEWIEHRKTATCSPTESKRRIGKPYGLGVKGVSGAIKRERARRGL